VTVSISPENLTKKIYTDQLDTKMANSKYKIVEGVVVYNSSGAVVATANIANVSNSEAVLTYVDESQNKIYTEWKQFII
jgi:hypothetical protein